MPYYQFAKQLTPISDPVADLKRLRFITDADVKLTDANQLWRHLLQRVAVHTPTAASFETWLGQWLANPTLDLATWLNQATPVTNTIFTRVSCQLLGFEPGRDFDLTDPSTFLTTSKLTLPLGDEPSRRPPCSLTSFGSYSPGEKKWSNLTWHFNWGRLFSMELCAPGHAKALAL